MHNKVPQEFIDDYKKSTLYEDGDIVTGIDAGVHSLGYSYMDLYVEDKEGEKFIVPFYFNQLPYESDEDEMSEADWIESDVDSWIDSMAGATEWTDWYNDAEIREL
jgi:hypothetical protein